MILSWGPAMAEALYGPAGFYRRQAAAGHFRTSAGAPLFGAAIGRLAAEVDAALGWPDPFDLIDVGAGGGELLADIAAPGVPPRWRLTAVEVQARSAADGLRWRTEVPRGTGLLVANEWLDNVPCEVVERTDRGFRLVQTDDTLGPPPSAADVAWLDRWWPLARAGDRAEVGRSRDAAWAGVLGRLSRGVAVAIDYSHSAAARPPSGTLISYREGRALPPVADGSADLTAHVALDACAVAAAGGGRVVDSLLTSQRAALPTLGVSGRPPRYAGDPAAYVAALSAAGAAAELLDPAGLGAFGWLVQSVGVGLPSALVDLAGGAPRNEPAGPLPGFRAGPSAPAGRG